MKIIQFLRFHFLAFILMCFVLAFVLTACSGCKSTGSTPAGGTNTAAATVENTLADFTKSLLATNGLVTAVANEVVTVETSKLVSQAIAKDPASKAYFIDAQNAIGLLISGGNVSSASLSKSLSQIPITGPAAPIIQAGITSLIGAYQQAEATDVAQKIDTVPYLTEFLSAVNTGITQSIQ